MARVLFPLPDRDFDPTEVAVPWRVLTDAGHECLFATETGNAPACDPRMIDGAIFGKLGAAPEACAFYAELEQARPFQRPVTWAAAFRDAPDALFLAGGHAPGMRQYLGSPALQALVADFFRSGKPVGAICHGVLVLARAGVLAGRKTTCLPKYMERSAYLLTFWKLGKYYRTYPEYVEDEVRAAGADVLRGPRTLTKRGTATDDAPAFVVEDGPYVSARWPGDAYLVAKKLAARLSR